MLALGAARLGRRAGVARPPRAAARRRGRRRLAAAARSRDLAKTYRGGFSAVKGVSFTVEHGMVLGLLGPNGAGKTTVLRMLMGLIRPDGRARSARSASRWAPARRCWPGSGRSSRARASCRTCPARRTCGCTGRPPAARRARRTSRRRWRSPGSAASIDRRVGTYSQGMRQRLAIAQAMLGLPELLVLDEPTNGLDPPQIHAMREVLRALRRGRAHGAGVQPPARRGGADLHARRRDAPAARWSPTARSTTSSPGGGAATFTVDAPERAAAVLGGLAGVHAVARRRRRGARRAERHPARLGRAGAGHRRGRRGARPGRGGAWRTRSCSSSERTPMTSP